MGHIGAEGTYLYVRRCQHAMRFSRCGEEAELWLAYGPVVRRHAQQAELGTSSSFDRSAAHVEV